MVIILDEKDNHKARLQGDLSKSPKLDRASSNAGDRSTFFFNCCVQEHSLCIQIQFHKIVICRKWEEKNIWIKRILVAKEICGMQHAHNDGCMTIAVTIKRYSRKLLFSKKAKCSDSILWNIGVAFSRGIIFCLFRSWWYSTGRKRVWMPCNRCQCKHTEMREREPV